jgi:hypothetical protein
VQLFFNYFSIKIQIKIRKYHSFRYAADRPVNDIKTLFNYPPLFDYQNQLVSEFRDYYTNALPRKNIALSSEDIE